MTNNLSDAELNLAVAESIEPLAVLASKRPRPGFLALSKELCWIGSNPHKWQPRDFINDPVMRDKLQQKLLNEGWHMDIYKREDQTFSLMLDKSEGRYECHQVISNYNRLWPEAWLATRRK